MLRANALPRGFLSPRRGGSQSVSLPPTGCMGALAHELAREHPSLRVTVFNRPEAIERLACFQPAGRRTEQVSFVPGKGCWVFARGRPSTTSLICDAERVSARACAGACMHVRVRVCCSCSCLRSRGSVCATDWFQHPVRHLSLHTRKSLNRNDRICTFPQHVSHRP